MSRTASTQMLARLANQLQLDKVETGQELGSEILDSGFLIDEGLRKYQEEAEDTGLEFSEYNRKGANIGAGQTLATLAAPHLAIPAAILGFGLRRNRDKPSFEFDLGKAVPGFENRLFGKQKGLDLISSIEGTRKFTSKALEGSLLADFFDTARSTVDAYGDSGTDESLINWLRGIETASKVETEPEDETEVEEA